MKRISKYRIQRKLEDLIDWLVRRSVFVFLLKSYYRLALKSLVIVLKWYHFPQLIRVYLRHQDWTLGISDIDLVFLIRSQGHSGDVKFFKRFWQLYAGLKRSFPMLCDPDEIRFMCVDQLNDHPLKNNPESFLLLTFHKWQCLYSQSGSDPSLNAFCIDIKGQQPMPPHTRFLHFNFYGQLQWALLAGQVLSELKFRRLHKSMLKILQHLFWIDENCLYDIDELKRKWDKGENRDAKEQLAGEIFDHLNEIPYSISERRRLILDTFRKSAFLIHRTHDEHYDLNEGALTVKHCRNDEWLGKPLKEFIEGGKNAFSGQFQTVVIKPICEQSMRAYILIQPEMEAALFDDLLLFIEKHNQRLFESKVRAMVTTDKILTSQFYTLWSPYALEASILLARESYDPDGALRIKKPPEPWILWKIRNSVSIFEEYYLPLLTSPMAKGTGMDFCKMYERPEIEMLFHYFYYLKDPVKYEQDLKEVEGDSNEILCITASKYGNEIGIGDWRPYRYESAYPYVKKLIRIIDRMAMDRMKLTL